MLVSFHNGIARHITSEAGLRSYMGMNCKVETDLVVSHSKRSQVTKIDAINRKCCTKKGNVFTPRTMKVLIWSPLLTQFSLYKIHWKNIPARHFSVKNFNVNIFEFLVRADSVEHILINLRFYRRTLLKILVSRPLMLLCPRCPMKLNPRLLLTESRPFIRYLYLCPIRTW